MFSISIVSILFQDKCYLKRVCALMFGFLCIFFSLSDNLVGKQLLRFCLWSNMLLHYDSWHERFDNLMSTPLGSLCLTVSVSEEVYVLLAFRAFPFFFH